MRTEYLREFVVLSRHLSFTEAAKELFIAQSTLSTHIAALESGVGFSLIDRKAATDSPTKGAVFSTAPERCWTDSTRRWHRCREMGDPDATSSHRCSIIQRPRSQPSSKSAYPCPLLSSSTITGIPSSSPSSMARPTSCSITTTRLSPRS
ncbi:MAG: LysR family transcriptional regulator [Adlercreutzia equolifaciens]